MKLVRKHFYVSMRPLLLVFLVLTFSGQATVQAQQTDSTDTSRSWQTYVELLLMDGTRLVGEIESRTDEQIVLISVAGSRYEVHPAQVRKEREVRGRVVNGVFQAADPNLSRTLFAPSGRAVPKGAGYVVLHELFFLSGAYGLGGAATLSAGLSLFPGAEEQLVWFAPKISLMETPTFSLAAGALILTLTGTDGSGGILYGVATVGDQRRSLSLGTGFFYGNGEVASTPVLLFSGDVMISRNVKLVSENYTMPGISTHALISMGLRFIVTSKVTVDLAGFTIMGESAPVLPWLGMSWGW